MKSNSGNNSLTITAWDMKMTMVSMHRIHTRNVYVKILKTDIPDRLEQQVIEPIARRGRLVRRLGRTTEGAESTRAQCRLRSLTSAPDFTLSLLLLEVLN